jgi:hypothetical protein|tara:strand:+ start:2953 stop:3540 length:588 start_codon:yes stop_codon:yes gene_type:complete
VGNIAGLLIKGASDISFSFSGVIGILVRESDIVRQTKKDTNATAEATIKAKEKLKLSAMKNPIGGAYNWAIDIELPMYDIPSPRLDSGARLATTVLVATGAIARPTPWAIRTGTIHHSLGRGMYKTVVPTNINIPNMITLLGPDFKIHLPAIGRKITPANPKVAIMTPISHSFPPSLSINPGTTIKREKNPARSR